MMSEEEEEAFEIVKNITKKDLLDCWDYGEKEFKAIQTILNLIEKQQKEIEREKQYTDFYKDLCDKQQKEIEEYKETINALKPNLKELIKMSNFAMQKDYISKDEIRATIEDLEKHRIMSSDDFTIKVLRALLKE